MTPVNTSHAAVHGTFLPLADPSRTGTALQPLFDTSKAPNTHVLVTQVLSMQYKCFRKPDAWPRTHARVSYRVRPAQGATADDFILQGWACLRGTTPFPQRTPAPYRASLDDLELHLWPIRDDADLPGLPALCNLPHGPRPQLVSYRPGVRAVLRVPRHGDTPETYVKTFSSARQARLVHARSVRLQAEGAPRCAPPLAMDPDHLAVWHLGVPGRSLSETLQHGFDAQLVHGIVTALVRLHGLRHDGLPSVRAPTLLEDALKKLDRLVLVLPALGARVEPLRRAMLREASAAADTPQVSLHGDFHLRQWLHHASSLTLCDFDEFCLGAPEIDLASLYMDLALYGLAPRDLTAWFEALARDYAGVAPWGLQRASLRWHLRLQTVNKMHRAMVQLHAEPDARCLHFLNHLDAALETLAS